MESVIRVTRNTYTSLDPIITPEGLAAGWRFDYPVMINKGGVNFSKLGFSLADLTAKGYVRWERQLHHDPV